MKPGDHPEFFRFPAPAGRSRESTITLDRSGRFFHDGEPIEKKSMTRAFFGWLRRHPDDGRFILSNGYDWTYLTVEDTPFFVTTLGWPDAPVEKIHLGLSDGTQEVLDPSTLRVDREGVVYCRVKNGQYEARFTPGAQSALGPVLREAGSGDIVVHLGGVDFPLPPRDKNASK